MSILFTLLALLIPAAFLSGWWDRPTRGCESFGGRRSASCPPITFRGLNYLLNEEQDKAIEVFLKLADTTGTP